MRYFYAKKDIICSWCKSLILRGELVARASFTKVNKETGAKQNFGYCYHADPCYVLAFTERYNKSLMHWKQLILPRKKRGRPRESLNPEEHHRLKALLRHHKKAGNEDRVKEIEDQLAEMELDKEAPYEL